jgi:hypothetical protein
VPGFPVPPLRGCSCDIRRDPTQCFLMLLEELYRLFMLLRSSA